MPKKLRQFQIQDRPLLERMYQNIKIFTDQIAGKPILDGVLQNNIEIGAGDTTIAHKLGRPYQGFIVVNKTTNTNIWAEPAKQTIPSRNLVVSASAASVISIYVF